jgi:hypothetical protein
MESPDEESGKKPNFLDQFSGVDWEKPKKIGKWTLVISSVLALLAIFGYGCFFFGGKYALGEYLAKEQALQEAKEAESEVVRRKVRVEFDHPDPGRINRDVGIGMTFEYFGDREDSTRLAQSLKLITQVAEIKYSSVERREFDVKPTPYVVSDMRKQFERMREQALAEEKEQPEIKTPEKKEPEIEVQARRVYTFTGSVRKNKGGLETIAIQKMLNKNDSTKLRSDRDGHGSPGREICTWGGLTQSAFEKDQKIHWKDIEMITGKTPTLGVYDYVMVGYYNWRMENIPEYTVYTDEIAGSCEDQKKRIALEQ